MFVTETVVTESARAMFTPGFFGGSKKGMKHFYVFIPTTEEGVRLCLSGCF